MATLNVAMMLEHAARTTPDHPFLSGGRERLSYADVDVAARRFANVLASLGVTPGERVALLMANCTAFVVCYYGVLKAGAVAVPLHPSSPGPEVAYFLEDSGASVLIAAGATAAAATAGFDAVSSCRHLVVDDSPDDPERVGGLSLEPLLSAASADHESWPTVPQDVAVILYTSGTTGRPKGAKLTHFNVHFFSRLLAGEFWRLTADDVVLMAAPPAHIFGLAILNVSCAAGARIFLLPRFDVALFLDAVDAEGVTFFAGVPTLAQHLLRAPLAHGRTLGDVRLVMLGGAALEPELVQAFRDRFGVPVITGYGMTEGVPLTYLTEDTMDSAPPGSVGRAAWGTDIAIVDDAGVAVPAGEPGEIVVRGPQLFDGYHDRPDESASVWRNGWFRTGDVGRMDGDGHLFVLDRLKDLIKRSGYSVYPAEIERVLHAHEAVAEAVVVGVSDPMVGEEVKAFVALRPGRSISADELIRHCRATLASYKVPRLVEFRDALPRNPTGKLLRRALRE